MKTWLKGGLIGAGIYILINILMLFMIGSMLQYFVYIFPIIMVLRESLINLGIHYFLTETYLGYIISILINSIFFFIIGAIIGLIIQKVKKK